MQEFVDRLECFVLKFVVDLPARKDEARRGAEGGCGRWRVVDDCKIPERALTPCNTSVLGWRAVGTTNDLLIDAEANFGGEIQEAHRSRGRHVESPRLDVSTDDR